MSDKSQSLGLSKLSALEVFRAPTKNYLIQELEKIGHDPKQFEPVLEKAIDQAIEETDKLIQKTQNFTRSMRFWKGNLEESALGYLTAVLTQDKKIVKLHQHIRSYNSVFIVGAGLSFESDIPLSAVLESLLSFCGSKSYEELKKNPDAVFKFKNEFKRICDKKKPSLSHIAISEFFPKDILEIICLNWDNMIELAAQSKSKSIPKINEETVPISGERYLWKFHGDVDKVGMDNRVGSGGWVFPTDGGYVLDCFLKYLQDTKIKEMMFTLVIVGYSESDGTIYEKVINLLEHSPKRPTFRIVLDLKKLHDEQYIVGPSDYVLPKILN